MRQPLVKRPTRFGLVILAFSLAGAAYAQSVHSFGESQAATSEASLAEQLTELRAKVARIEAALEQNHQVQSSAPVVRSHHEGMGHGGGNMSMSGAGMKRGMGMMGQKSRIGMGGMSMMGKGMRMMGMMKGMGGSQGMAMQSVLPGFPGASHLYHIGGTSFLLDHADHIQLTTEQQSALNQIKEKTALEQATTERKIEEAEQQLWQATASDRPDASAIAATIREIEKLRGDQRLAFIRAIGEAAKVLTHDQHQTLTGAHSAPTSPADHTSHEP